jgi:ankyrin repeat protein
MNADAGDREAEEKYERTRDRMFSENEQALDAVERNNFSMMDEIFKTGGIKQEAIDYLIFSVRSVEMLKLFLRYSGDMHKLGPTDYPHPVSLLLFFASGLEGPNSSEFVKLIEFLVDEEVDVNSTDKDGETLFIYCARYGNSKLCRLIVDRGGADPYAIRRYDKMTALHFAAQHGHIVVSRYLVEECVLNIDAMTHDLRTPLFLAALKGHFEVNKYLLEKGASVDSGYQPLSAAAQVLRLFCFIFSRMVTLMCFSFSWITGPILFLLTLMEEAHFTLPVMKGVLISSNCSTSLAHAWNCCTSLMEGYFELFISIGCTARCLPNTASGYHQVPAR